MTDILTKLTESKSLIVMSRMCVIGAVFISGLVGITGNIVMKELSEQKRTNDRMIETVAKNDQQVKDDHELLMKIVGAKYGDSINSYNRNTKQ